MSLPTPILEWGAGGGERTQSDRMLKSPGVAMETSRSVFLTCKGRDLMRSEWEEEEAA